MTKKQPKKNLKPPLTISPEDLEKIKKRKARDDAIKVDGNWMFIAEFGYYFGWEGIEAILYNKIDYDTAVLLARSAQKVWAGKVYDYGKASFIGSLSARSKRNTVVFNKLMKETLKEAKPEII